MPLVTQTGSQDEEFYSIYARGPAAQFIPQLSPPATIGASATWDSAIVLSDGFGAISAGATLSNNGSIKITRYLDTAGLVVLDVTTANLTAATAGAVSINDGKAFAAYKISVVNGAASVANLTNFGAILSA